MSQRLSQTVAESLKKGDTLYHNIIVFTGEDGEQIPATAKVTGKCKPHAFEDFVLPIKRNYGAHAAGQITKHGADYWRTTPEKEVVRHVVRTRLPKSEPEDEPVAPVRVKRTRR